MPNYYCENGSMAKFRTDEEKIAGGFMSGNCVESAINRLIMLYEKFGNHFDLVVSLVNRKSCSIGRLMNDEEWVEFYNKGKYLIHFNVYNRKTEQYIDTSNNEVVITSKEYEHRKFTSEWNNYYALYHFSMDYIMKYQNGKVGQFCYNIMKKQHHNVIFDDEYSKKLEKRGVVVIKS